MKKLFRTIKKKLRPLLLIPIVLLAGVLVGGYFLFFDGDDNTADTATVGAPASPPPSTKTGPEQGSLTKPGKTKTVPQQPAGKEFTIDSDRDEKDNYSLANATGPIKTPSSISVRIGAAPKQPVTVYWNIVCLLTSEGAKMSSGNFEVTPPVTRKLMLPVPDAVTCTATATAQLTRAGRGRIKVFLVGQRRAGA